MITLAVLMQFCAAARAANMAEEVLNAKDIAIREDFAIVVDGDTLTPDVPPVERGGVIFIPLRFAAEARLAEVTWYKEEKKVVLKYPGDRIVTMKVGDLKIDMGDTEKFLPVAPFIFEGRTMIPLKQTAESGLFRVEERPNAMIIESSEAVKGYEAPGTVEVPDEGERPEDNEDYVGRAKSDQVTKKLRPYVLIAWVLAGILWIAITIIGIKDGRLDHIKSQILILLILSAGVCFILYSHVMLSTYWAAIVAIGTCIVGLVSTESYTEKLVTMASTAQGFGLICTLFGLGLLIGPAIAERDIAAIGYGIYVKIEPTITGLTLSIILNMLFGYEARKESAKEASAGSE